MTRALSHLAVLAVWTVLWFALPFVAFNRTL